MRGESGERGGERVGKRERGGVGVRGERVGKT